MEYMSFFDWMQGRNGKRGEVFEGICNDPQMYRYATSGADNELVERAKENRWDAPHMATLRECLAEYHKYLAKN